MKGTCRKTIGKRVAAAWIAVMLAVVLALPALASTIPSRPENQYVLDEAGVLSEETEQEIISKNQELFEETGAQIVVVAVDFLGGDEIDDYAYMLFNSWGIGSEERNNGLLLLMAIGEDNYYSMAGYGIENYFDGAKLQDMLNQYLEPDFAAKDYDAGAKKFFQEALSEMESYYAGYHDEYTDQRAGDSPNMSYEEDPYAPSFTQRVLWFLSDAMEVVIRVVVVLLLAAAIIGFLAARRGGPRPPRGGGGGGGGGFWSGMFLGSLLGNSYRRGRYYGPPPPRGLRPPRGGGFGGGFGGFHGGGGGGFGGGGFRGGGGGFHGGGGTRGGGAGRR